MGGKHRPGTPRDRALGAELRAIREQAGFSLGQVAAKIQWNVSTLSRLERGQRRISPEAVMGLALVLGLDANRRNELIERAKQPVTLGWWDRPPLGVPSDLGALASYEYQAARLTDWACGVIPGMLQTADYAEAIMRDWGIPDTEIHPRIGARRKRQEILDKAAVDYTAFLGIAAIRNRMTSDSVFVAQLRHLIRMSRRDGVVIRVVEAPSALAVGSWYLMDFVDTGSVVHIEHLQSSTFLFDGEAAAYKDARRKLGNLALSERATHDRLDAVIEQSLVGG